MPAKQFRTNYDLIADRYDSQPYRNKEVDSHLVAFLEEIQAPAGFVPAILDLGCGTGNQLVANRTYLPRALLVGADLFRGMLRQAQPKADDIYWVQADSAFPPLADEHFDYISSQYSFHHVQAKMAMIKAIFRLLRAGGRFVMASLCPREMTDWLYYKYFPAALEADLRDFPPGETIKKWMQAAGFVKIRLSLNHLDYQQDLAEFLVTVRRRDTCSQLLTISDKAYQSGLRRLERELKQASRPPIIDDKVCLLTIQGDKPQAAVT